MKLLGLKKVTKSNGRVYWYYRHKSGQLTPLPDAPHDSPEFLIAYAEAKQLEPAKEPNARAYSLKALAIRYLDSPAFKAIKPTSQRVRRRIVERIVEGKAGDVLARAVERKHIQRDIDKCSLGSAKARLAAWRALMRLAVREEWRKDDPTISVERTTYKAKSHPRWSPQDIAAYTETWPLGTQQRLAFELLYWTGCRRSDVVMLGWPHVKDGWISFRQTKTGELLEIPISKRLALALEQAPKDKLTFMETAYGASRSGNAFGEWFKRACATAGVTKSAHGLRHEFGSAGAEAGLGNAHIGPMLGHASLSEADTYTKSVNRRRMVEEGMARLEQERDLETRLKKLGN